MSPVLSPLVKAWVRAQRDLGLDAVFFDQPVDFPAPTTEIVKPIASTAPPKAMAHPQSAPQRTNPEPPVARQPPRAPMDRAPLRTPDPVARPAAAPPPQAAPVRAPAMRLATVPTFASREELGKHAQACTRCALKEREATVWQGGATSSPWLVLTLYGWGEDLKNGKLLSGGYAKAFLELVNKVGLPEPAMAAVLCCPPLNPADTSVQGRIEAARCRPYWTQLLKFTGAKAILVLDHKATQLAVGKAVDWAEFRSRRFLLENVPALATHHPARLARSQEMATDVENDLRQILSIVEGKA
jgi:uracil-DNA glycosylase family 4